MSELIEIGKKINDSILAVWNIGLTIEELEIFEAYIHKQEIVAPLLNPSFIQKHGFKLLDGAKKRIELLKPIIQLKEPTEPKTSEEEKR